MKKVADMCNTSIVLHAICNSAHVENTASVLRSPLTDMDTYAFHHFVEISY